MNKISIGLSLIAIVVAGFAFFHAASSQNVFGATADCGSTTCLSGGLRITDGVLESDGVFNANGDANVAGGTLNVTTSNTATSTIVGGCFQFYATSTATALKFQASTTPGVMVSQYGTCPNS